jgi:glycosyltransferase involved in cell wall biosynthesis
VLRTSNNGKQPAVRVALLATSVEFGGIERVLLNLVQHMDEDFELCPIVFTRTDTRETSFFDRLQRMGVHCETLFVNSHTPALVVNPIVNFGQALSLFRKRRFDLIHAHGYRADLFGWALSKWCRVPAVSTCHGFVATDRRLRSYVALDKRVLKSFARVIAVSAAMKDDLVAEGLHPDRVDVVTNAVPEVSGHARARVRDDVRARLGIPPDEFVFGCVGRLSEEKGIDYLVRAAARLADAGHPLRLLVVGDGPRRKALEDAARDVGLNGRIIFAGFQSDPEPWLAAMDAFVLPSLTEGTPMALLEAMASRVPAIASAVGGVPAVLMDRENGLLVPPADVPRLADAMLTMAGSASLRETLSEGGLVTVRQQYGVRQWICQTRDVYARTLRQSLAA